MPITQITKLPEMYCPKCGHLLLNDVRLSGYDIETGEQLFIVYSRCPNRRHWFDGHYADWRHESFMGDKMLKYYDKNGNFVV